MERMRGYQESRQLQEEATQDPNAHSTLEETRQTYRALTEEERTERYGEAMEGLDKIIAEHADAMVDRFLMMYAPEGYQRPSVSDVRTGKNRYDFHQVLVQRIEDSTYGDAMLFRSMVHEKMHEASAQLIQASKGGLQAKLGLSISTELNNTDYFEGLNEAIISGFEHAALFLLAEDDPYRIAIRERNQKYLQTASGEAKFLIENFPLDTEIHESPEGTSIGSPYWRDQVVYAHMAKRMAHTLDLDFKAVDHAFKSAAISGDFSIIKKMIQQTFGATGMRVISRWTPIKNDETHKIFLDYMTDPNEENAEWSMRAFKTVICKVCGKESSGLHCVICDSPLYDDVTTRYDQPRQH